MNELQYNHWYDYSDIKPSDFTTMPYLATVFLLVDNGNEIPYYTITKWSKETEVF